MFTQDPVAVKVIRRTARYLGASIAHLVNLFNPEVVVLSSWVAAALGEPLVAEVHEAVARHALPRPVAALSSSPDPDGPGVPGRGNVRARRGPPESVPGPGSPKRTTPARTRRRTTPARSRTAPPS